MFRHTGCSGAKGCTLGRSSVEFLADTVVVLHLRDAGDDVTSSVGVTSNTTKVFEIARHGAG